MSDDICQDMVKSWPLSIEKTDTLEKIMEAIIVTMSFKDAVP